MVLVVRCLGSGEGLCFACFEFGMGFEYMNYIVSVVLVRSRLRFVCALRYHRHGEKLVEVGNFRGSALEAGGERR
jgi:hypothetical protein